MNARKITGYGLGLYFGCFVLAALLGLPRMYTYLAASGVGAVTVLYSLWAHEFRIAKDAFRRWLWLAAAFAGLIIVSYLVNRQAYDFSLTLKALGYGSVFVVSSLVAVVCGREAFKPCLQAYLSSLLFAMVVTLAVNNTNAHNHRLLGPTYKDDIQGSGLHHNEVGLLGMTAVMLSTCSGWPAVILITPPSIYTAYLAGSRGSMLGIVLALLVFVFLKEFASGARYRRIDVVPKRGLTLLGIAVLGSAAVAVFAGSFLIDDVLQLNNEKRGLGSGFTGRLDVWAGMVDHWKQSPIVGKGYGVVRGEARDLGNTADGGYLLLSSELGTLGLGLFVFLIWRTASVSWSNVLATGHNDSIAAMVFLVTFCFINLFESRFVGTGSIGLGIFLYLSCLSVFQPQTQTRTSSSVAVNGDIRLCR